MEEREILQERLELALLRIREIPGEDFQGAELLPWKEYFTTVAKFLLLIEDTRQFLEQGKQPPWKNYSSAIMPCMKIFCRKIMRTVLPIQLML